MSAEASKFVKPNGRSAKDSKGTVKDEFFVSSSDIVPISQYKEKIHKMYEVQLHFEDKTESGQWLILEGESGDRRNAKNYIKAICNPAEKKKVQFPSSACMELTDPATLEYIEKQTNAFIRPLEKIAQFEICGTELAVILALSQIEELIGAAVKDGEQFYDTEDIADGPSDGLIKISPATHDGSSRLNTLFERTFSHNSDGGYSVDDYHKMKPAVQRVLVSFLQNDEDNVDNIDDDLLFAEGDSTDSAGKTDFSAYNHDGGNGVRNMSIENDGEASLTLPKQNSPTGRQFTEKLTELSIADSAEPSELLNKQQTYLQTFGLTLGFTEHQVEAVIGKVDEKTRPSDFLDMLNSLSSEVNESEQSPGISNDSGDDVVILSTEIVDSVTGETTVVNEVPKGNKTSSKKLPNDYAERLRRDFATEGDCTIEELKKRNSERQKLLKENFEKQRSQQSEPKKGKKKGKKKKGQQVQNQPQTSKDREGRHEKQFRLDTDDSESRTYSSDSEQTCVLQVWNADKDLNKNNAKSEPIQVTPKRKNCKGKNFNQQQRQGPPPQQNSGQAVYRETEVKGHQANRGQGYGPYAGPVGRGFYLKPTQFVTPVKAASGANAAIQRPGNSKPLELRYIVIDGSNVAMTHGNGKVFSCKGIKLCVDYFRQRGHTDITVFVPHWRQYKPSDENSILDQPILHELKDEGILVFTPSRRIRGKLVVNYDDRFVLELAERENAIIVSNDQYRDLMNEKAAWRKIIEERLLLFTFVKDHFMPPEDPLGRDGPSLDEFLQDRKKKYLPQGRWQAYNHQQQQQQWQQYRSPHRPGNFSQGHNQETPAHFIQGQGDYAKAAYQGLDTLDTDFLPLSGGNPFKPSLQSSNDQFDEVDASPSKSPRVKGQWRNAQKGQPRGQIKPKGIKRTDEETAKLFQDLRNLFPDPDQEEKVRAILSNHETEKSFTKLTNYCMSVLFD